MSKMLLQDNIGIVDSVNLKLCKKISDIFLLEDLSIDGQSMVVGSEIKPNAGDTILLKERTNIFQSGITLVNAIDKDKFEITVDTPADNIFTTDCVAEIGNKNLKMDGSVELDYASFNLNGLEQNVSVYINKIIFRLEDKDESIPESFGGRNKLKNGIVLRVSGCDPKNIVNIKQNKDFVMNFYNVGFPEKHLSRKYIIFAEKKYRDIIIGCDDMLEIIIQDDIKELDQMAISFQGHIIIDN